jgi:DNA invertase Pin-like site-specific DNA recombinase
VTIRAYIRVSSRDQDPDAQIRALRAHGYDLAYTETISGRRTDRTEWTRLIDDLQSGDILLFWKTDRWARSAGHAMTTIKNLHERGVTIKSLTENFDLTTKEGRLMFGMLSLVAEFETEVRAERCAAGIEAMKERQATGAMRPGKQRSGRPKVTGPSEATLIHAMREQGIGFPEIARTLKISESSARRAVRCA